MKKLSSLVFQETTDTQMACDLTQRPARTRFYIFWCAIQCFILLCNATASIVFFGWQDKSCAIFVCHVVVIVLLVSFVLAMKYVPKIRRYASRLLCVALVILLGWTGWMLHSLVAGFYMHVKQQVLADVWQILQTHNESASLHFEQYLLKELSSRMFVLLLLFDFVILDLVRFFGSIRLSAVACFTVPTVLITATFASSVVSNDMVDMIVLSVGLSVYAFLSGVSFQRLQKRQLVEYCQQMRVLVDELSVTKQAINAESHKVVAYQQADSALSHVIKNLMADAVGCIDLASNGTPPEVHAQLQSAVDCLERGMKWCGRRQMMQAILDETYTPQLAPISMQDFGEALIRHRPVKGHFSNAIILADPQLLDTVADNALSNSLRHRDPAHPDVHCSFEVMHLHPVEEGEARATIVLRVCNHADPSKPELSDRFVARMMAGEDVCSPRAAAFSKQLGLRHLMLAAKAHNMTVSLRQENNVVTFTATFVVEIRPLGGRSPVPSSPTVDFPEGLRIFCLDDSDVARRLLSYSLETFAKGTHVKVFGRSAQEVREFTREAPAGAELLILDQHLEYEENTFLGTDLIKELVLSGYNGFICIRSANTAPQDLDLYLASGAHYVMGKDVRAEQMIHKLKQEYHRYMQQSIRIPQSPAIHRDPTNGTDSLHLTLDLHTPTGGNQNLMLCGHMSNAIPQVQLPDVTIPGRVASIIDLLPNPHLVPQLPSRAATYSDFSQPAITFYSRSRQIHVSRIISESCESLLDGP